jgi:uncharacterized phage-associated protein
MTHCEKLRVTKRDLNHIKNSSQWGFFLKTYYISVMNKTISVEFSLRDLKVSPLSLANFFYQRGISSHLVIQKLIYFSFLKGLKKNLLFFEEKFQAWRYGPVLRSVFVEMTNCDNLDEMFGNVSPITNEEIKIILEEIYQEYQNSQDDVWDLVDKSHDEPWKKARGNLGIEEPCTNEIELADLIIFTNQQKNG